MERYTITNRHGDIEARDCSLAEAADAILTYDGYTYDIRPAADGGFVLWVSQFSRNSPLGNRPLVKSVIYSLRDDRAGAVDQIHHRVIAAADAWHMRATCEEE